MMEFINATSDWMNMNHELIFQIMAGLVALPLVFTLTTGQRFALTLVFILIKLGLN